MDGWMDEQASMKNECCKGICVPLTGDWRLTESPSSVHPSIHPSIRPSVPFVSVHTSVKSKHTLHLVIARDQDE